MNLIHLESFLAVARAGGFRDASKKTGIAQPTLSQHVRKLEQDLDVILLLRQNNGCTLTEAGRVLGGYADSLLATAQQARRAISQRTLVIGASSNIGVYLLPEKIARFRRQHADVDLQLTLGDNLTIVRKLEGKAIDIALMEWWDERPGFNAQPWRHDELVVIVDPAHEWANRSALAVAELQGQSLLGGETASGTGRLLQQRLGSVAATLRTDTQLGSTEAVKRAVQAGLGISIVLLASVSRELQQGSLCALRIQGHPLHKQLFMVHASHWPAQSTALQLRHFLAMEEAMEEKMDSRETLSS